MRAGSLAGPIVHSRTTSVSLTDSELWQMRTEIRKTMLTQVRARYLRQLSAEGASHVNVTEIFKENLLTIGFARRFATYKRPDLLLHDPERLIRLLTDSRATSAIDPRRQGPPRGYARARR